jgi:hypothetical protein
MFVVALGANDHTMYDWIIDFGATKHMTFERKWFTTYESIVPRKVYMGENIILEAISKGSIKATIQVGSKMLLITITEILHVPKMKNCLISVNKLISKNSKWSLTRMVVRRTMSMGFLWRKHVGRRTCIFSTSMFERRVQMWQSLQMKELRFSTKDSATSTWQVLKSWIKWSMA